MTFLTTFLHDLVKLKLPVTAAAVAALIVELVSPFGLDVGSWGPRLTACLVGVGTLAAYIEHLRGEK